MRTLLSMLALGGAMGCFLPSTAPCPTREDVEKTYSVTTSCGELGDGAFAVTNLTVNHQVDCPSGCISVASASVEPRGGPAQVSGGFESSCGSDPGTLWLTLSSDAGAVTECQQPMNTLGQAISCPAPDGGTCSATVSAR